MAGIQAQTSDQDEAAFKEALKQFSDRSLVKKQAGEGAPSVDDQIEQLLGQENLMEQIEDLETRDLEKLGAVERLNAVGKRTGGLPYWNCWKKGTVCVFTCSNVSDTTLSRAAGTMLARSSSVRVIACSNPSQVPPLYMHVGK